MKQIITRQPSMSDEECLLRFSSTKKLGCYIDLFDIREKVVFTYINLNNRQHLRGMGLNTFDIHRLQSGEIHRNVLSNDIESIRKYAIILMKYRRQLLKCGVDYPAMLFDVSNDNKQDVNCGASKDINSKRITILYENDYCSHEGS